MCIGGGQGIAMSVENLQQDGAAEIVRQFLFPNAFLPGW